MKKLTHKTIFLSVYIMISLATLYHSAFGFGTLHGLPSGLQGYDLFQWWFLGFICATAIDVGMGAVVWAMINGYRNKYLILSLLVLSTFSAYSQLVYSAYHSSDMVAITENISLKPFMQTILDIRIIILPLCLPFFSLFYGFVAKDSSILQKGEEESEYKPNQSTDIIVDKSVLEDILKPEQSVEKVTKTNNKTVTHLKNGSKTMCGLGNVSNSTTDDKEITCKNCLSIMKNYL